MEFGICELSSIPVRVEPSEQAEMGTQLLFGDIFVVLEKKSGYLKIRNIDDNYEG